MGTWYDRTAQYQAALWSDGPVDEEDSAEEEEVVLTPLPCWAHYTEEERRELVRAMIAELVEADAWPKHKLNGTRPLGVRKVLSRIPGGGRSLPKSPRSPGSTRRPTKGGRSSSAPPSFLSRPSGMLPICSRPALPIRDFPKAASRRDGRSCRTWRPASGAG